MDQTGENVPARLAVLTDRFGRLQQVFDLRQVQIWVAIVHELIQELHRLPDAHPRAISPEKLGSLLPAKLDCLVRMVQPVKLFYRRSCLSIKISERIMVRL